MFTFWLLEFGDFPAWNITINSSVSNQTYSRIKTISYILSCICIYKCRNVVFCRCFLCFKKNSNWLLLFLRFSVFPSKAYESRIEFIHIFDIMPMIRIFNDHYWFRNDTAHCCSMFIACERHSIVVRTLRIHETHWGTLVHLKAVEMLFHMASHHMPEIWNSSGKISNFFLLFLVVHRKLIEKSEREGKRENFGIVSCNDQY